MYHSVPFDAIVFFGKIVITIAVALRAAWLFSADNVRHSGMLAYSASRQIFCNEAWAMSVLASDEDRAGFVRSAVHQEAIAKSSPAIVSIQLKRLTLSRKDAPMGWPRAL
jgi:hypothetical protein